jgi:hypothetical protein
MPDARQTIRHFSTVFRPERIRAVFLMPQSQPNACALRTEIFDCAMEIADDGLAEVIVIDGRQPHAGLILADFLDYT